MTRQLILAAIALAALGAIALTGCARGGEETGPIVPQAVLDAWVKFAGPVDDSAYYYIALDQDGDFGVDYPVPIAAGPYWGNGWGTGSITHFLAYRLGMYELCEATLTPVLREAGGGITQLGGVPTGGDAGHYTLTVGAISFGAVTVSGSGMVTSATNSSGQNAGAIALETDAAGNVMAGSVAFTPAADGGRAANATERAQIAALNAGGVSLTSNALDAFGISLSLSAPAAGAQDLSIAPAEAAVESKFVPAAAGAAKTTAATLRANSATPTATPPIPGGTITTTDLLSGGRAEIDVEISQTPTLIGPPYEFVPPAGGTILHCLIDLGDLAPNLNYISINVITTSELIFDPTLTDPDRHSYDGLGPLGNDAITISTKEFRGYSNSGSLVPERSNDSTLEGPASPQQKDAIDIIDWWFAIKRLR